MIKYACKTIRELFPMYKDGLINKKENKVLKNKSIVNYTKRHIKKTKVFFTTIVCLVSALFLGLIFMGIYIITGGLPTKTSDIKDYGVFENFKGYSNLYIFPTQMPKSARIDSYYYYYMDTLFDPTCQIYLEYSLSKSDFDAEVLKISKIYESYEHEHYKDQKNEIVYDTDNFIYPAYVTIFNNNHCYEYALLNEEEHKIICVFTQFIEINKVKFDKRYLPIHFENEKNNDSFNIYYSENGSGYFERHKMKR